MNTVILEIDEQTVDIAKDYAQRQGQSLSQLVETYLKSLTTKQPKPNEESISQLNDFQKLLIDSPEMSDEEYRFIQTKRQSLNLWK